MCKSKEFATPFVHFHCGVVLEKIHRTIGMPAIATADIARSKKVIEGGAKCNESTNDSVNFSTQV